MNTPGQKPTVHVLVVDDERNIRVNLREFLVADGYTVAAASDAQEALRLLGDHDFDVVVSDIVLPRINGIELLQAIRTAAPRAQVIMMTGEPTADTAAEALRAGAFDYLTKPVSRNAILRAVGNAAKLKALDEERRREQEVKERYQQELVVAVTSLTAANEELHQAAAFRGEVENIVHHDLKAPLCVILAAPDLIRMMGGSLTEEQRSYLDMIENAGRRMLDMINRSLDLFKIEQGMYAFRPESVDLLLVMHEVISHHAALMRGKHLSAVILVDDRPALQTDTFEVPGERLLCYSMLGNLLKNAMEASPPGGAVTLRFERREAARMSICNRGAVPQNIRERFFEKFSTSGKEHGTGLGTYSARLIAEIHGAQIAVDTSVPDCTTVTVCFPGPPGPAIPPRSATTSAPHGN
jgi:two-component system sensor histidine kinase/response regulator